MPRHLRISLPAFTLSILLLVTGLLPVTSARADESMSQTPADQQVPADQADQKDAAQKAGDQKGADQNGADNGDKGAAGQDGADRERAADGEQTPADQKDAAQKADQTVSADALPTAQIGNGVVWDQEVVGNTVYVAGKFDSARPAGSAVGENEQSRSNLMAYDINTG